MFFDMITRKNESKIIAKHISFKCKSDGIKYKSNQNEMLI